VMGLTGLGKEEIQVVMELYGEAVCTGARLYEGRSVLVML